MPKELYIGIDLGTTIIKGSIISKDGEVIIQRTLRYDSPILSSFFKSYRIKEEICWIGFVGIVKVLLSEIGNLKDKLTAIAITATVPNLLLIDEFDKTLYTTLFFDDPRAKEIEKTLDSGSDRTRGQNKVLSKLIWLKNFLQVDWSKLQKIFSTHNYIGYKLTGQYYIDTITATEFGCIYDTRNKKWNHKILNKYDIDINLLPIIVAPLDVVGKINKSIAQLIGLPYKLNVIAGTSDTISTFLGSGAHKKTDMLIYYGTYNCAAFLKKDIIEILRGQISENPIEWVVSNPRAGQFLEKYAVLLCKSDSIKNSLKIFDDLASNSISGANQLFFLPRQIQEDANACLESPSCFVNIKMNHDLSDICRAMLEGFGYSLNYGIKLMGNKMQLGNCFASGGGAKSKLWRQIISDITGINQNYIPNSVKGIGSAYLAAISDDYNNYSIIKNNFFSKQQIILSSVNQKIIYEKNYELFKNFLSFYILSSKNISKII